MRTLRLTEPLAHQVPIDESGSRWKVWRGGRRSGKTKWASKSATDGHGPRQGLSGAPRFAGLLQGRDVAWVVRDYPQSVIFWHEFIEPTFEGIGELNKSDRTVDLGTGGRLWIKSSEAIESIRGLGENIGGVIFEEAAYYDTLVAFKREVRPILMDNKGWASWISSTRAGSEFNTICEEVISGKRSFDRGWEHFHTTPYDNPLLDPAEIADLIGEYTAGDDALREEVFAELLAGGGGYAFPEWRSELHTKRIEPLPNWRVSAGFDWGFDEPGCLAMAWAGPGGRVHFGFEHTFRQKTTAVVGWEIGKALLELGHYPEYIAYDSAMDHDGPTIVNEMQAALQAALPSVAVPLVPVAKGPGSRKASKLLLHELLRYKADDQGIVHEWGRPRFTVDPTRCPYLATSIPTLKKPSTEEILENSAKAGDISQKPKQDDHGYDSVRYLLMSREPHTRPEPEVIPENIHPGFVEGTYQRRDRVRSPENEAKELRLTLEARGVTSGGRYHRPRIET